jgi:hypothetical protein
MRVLLILPIIGATVGMLFASRLRGSNPSTVAIGCGLVALAGSTYTLLTESPQSLAYRFHLALMLVVAAAIFVRVVRMRRT